jgi:hypothetical protein
MMTQMRKCPRDVAVEEIFEEDEKGEEEDGAVALALVPRPISESSRYNGTCSDA